MSARRTWDATQILLGGFGVCILGAAGIALSVAILYAVGETVELFTP